MQKIFFVFYLLSKKWSYSIEINQPFINRLHKLGVSLKWRKLHELPRPSGQSHLIRAFKVWSLYDIKLLSAIILFDVAPGLTRSLSQISRKRESGRVKPGMTP